jgi:hypothetical protein
LNQAVFPQDAADGFVAAGQIMLSFETFGALKGKLFSQLDDFSCPNC